jgi:tight adherence protein C
MTIQGLVVLLFFLGGAFFLITAFASGEERVHLRRDSRLFGLDKEESTEKKKKEDKADLYASANMLGAFNALILNALPKVRDYYAAMLTQARMTLTPEGLLFLKELMLVLAAAIVILFELKGPMVVIPFVMGFLVPDMLVRQTVQNREFMILRTFPEVIDLIGLCLSAGLDFMSAMKWLTESTFRLDNPIVDDLQKVKEQIALGQSRAQALKAMDKELRITEVSSFVRTLIIAESMGVSVTESFERFSADVREGRFHRGERQARMASIKILFPLIFLIMPVVGIIIMGPIILKFGQNGFMGGGFNM